MKAESAIMHPDSNIMALRAKGDGNNSVIQVSASGKHLDIWLDRSKETQASWHPWICSFLEMARFKDSRSYRWNWCLPHWHEHKWIESSKDVWQSLESSKCLDYELHLRPWRQVVSPYRSRFPRWRKDHWRTNATLQHREEATIAPWRICWNLFINAHFWRHWIQE